MTRKGKIARLPRAIREELPNPGVRDLVCQNGINPEERERRTRGMFGLEPESPETPEASAQETAQESPNPCGLPAEPLAAPAASRPESNPLKAGKTIRRSFQH